MNQIRKHSLSIVARTLSLLSENSLDRVTRQAREFQHRQEDGWFKNKDTKEWQRCRMESTNWDDEIMAMSGCAGEFANDFRRSDMADGCPFCTTNIAENASEPDVMQRWDLISWANRV